MGLMQRFSTIFKAKASKTLDKYEDPRETLDYSYERTLEMLQKMRRAVADVATSRKRIELQAQQLQRSAAKLEDKAAQMQARSGALDELMASGALDDASMSSDRLQAELDRGFAEPAVEAELARLKGELTGSSTTAKQLDAPEQDAAPVAEPAAETP